MTEENNQNNNQEQNQAEQKELSEVEILQQKIAELEEKSLVSNDKLLRALAEIDNVRRRSREELEKTAKFAISNFVSELVLVVENFFLACDNRPVAEIAKIPAVQHFDDAIEMTKKELIKILEKNQVKRIYPLGEKFDHNFHDAIAQIESDKEEGEIVQVIQAGYTINDRLIRPALVGVAKPKA